MTYAGFVPFTGFDPMDGDDPRFTLSRDNPLRVSDPLHRNNHQLTERHGLSIGGGVKGGGAHCGQRNIIGTGAE